MKRLSVIAKQVESGLRVAGQDVVINGKKFAESKRTFNPSRHDGYLETRKKEVRFYGPDDVIVAALTAYGVLAAATPLDNGKIWFNYADPKIIGPTKMRDVMELRSKLEVDSGWNKKGERYSIYK